MTRIEQERETVSKMIGIYCRHKHHTKNGELCLECQELNDYAMLRLSKCKFGEQKPTCLRCPIHCYKPAMKVRIAQVMRYSGPWMLLYHPILTIKHLMQR